MRTTRVRPMVEGGILSAIAILFALISVYVPFIGVFVNLIWPVPIILLGVRHGYKWSLMATVVSGLLIAILLHPLHAIGVAIGFGLTGIVLGHCFRQNYSPVKSVMLGSVASLASKIIVLAISAVASGINPLADQSEIMSQAVEQAIGIYRSLGMKEEDLAQMTSNMKSMLEMMKLIFPAGFALASVVDTYLNFMVARAVLRKLGHIIPPFPIFRLWKMSPAILYGFILSVLMLYWGKSRELEWLATAGVNLQVATSMLLMLQGMSVAFFFATKHDVPKFIRWVFIAMAFTNGVIMQAVVFTGAIDMAFDFRKIRRPPTPPAADPPDPEKEQ
jgi:uncharacterized protein YybS (DUF2232 family)